MKKLVLITTIFSIIFFACSKKDKLQTDTLVIYVTPSSVTIEPGKSVDLYAVGKSAKSDNVDINPEWIVEPEYLGTVSPTKGKKVTFTASANTGSGRIKVVEETVYTWVNVSITSQTQSGGGGGGGGYTIYNDNGFSSDIKNGDNILRYFDGGDGSDNSAPWLINTENSTPGCNEDPQNCIKVSYTGTVNQWGGFYIEFNSTKDLSNYSKLTFYVKGESGGESFKVGIKDSNNIEKKIDVSGISTNWQKKEIPLSNFSGVSLSNVALPFILAFEGAPSRTIYIDLIKYE
jgi:hypothetical protein